MPCDFYIYIDRDDGNKIKAKNNRTGRVESTHATDANVPIQYAIDYLSIGSAQTKTEGPNFNLWTGGQYGSIFIGPGTYSIGNSIVAKSNITIKGSGYWNTEIRLVNSHANNNNATVIKSSRFDEWSVAGRVKANWELQQGDTGIVISDMTIDGNKANNATVTTRIPTPGVASWGHGVAIYGVGNTLKNLATRNCRGVGIILQAVGTNLGDDTSTVPVGSTENYIKNVTVANNDMHGFLCRAFCRVDTFWSYKNGEPGIDVQVCDYFSGWNSYFANMWCFYDSMNHGNQSSTTYDPLGSEIIVTGEAHMHNCFIEGPWCQGDNLTLGRPGATQNPSGYTLGHSSPDLQATGLMFDAARKYTIRLEPYSTKSNIQATIRGTHDPTGAYYDESAGVYLNGAWGNNLDLFVEQLSDATHGAALILDAGADYNNIKLSSWFNNKAFDFISSKVAFNNIQAQVTSNTSETVVANPNNVNWTTNVINIQTNGSTVGNGTIVGSNTILGNFTPFGGNTLAYWPLSGRTASLNILTPINTVFDTNFGADFEIWGNCDANNRERMYWASHGTLGYEVGVDATGTGSLRPVNFYMGANPIMTLKTDNSIDFNSRALNNVSGVLQDPIAGKRTGAFIPAGGTSATTIGDFTGAMGGHTAVGTTFADAFDTTEGLVATIATSTTANQNAGLQAGAGAAFCRTLFAGIVRARFKVDAVASSVSRFYVGVIGANAIPLSDTHMATGVPGVLFGFASTDAVYKVYHNDSCGPVQNDAFTGNIAKDTAYHTIEINWAANASSINVSLDGAIMNISSQIPSTSDDLWFHVGIQNATAAIRIASFKGVWVEFAK